MGTAGGGSSLVWVDRAGAEERIAVPPRAYRDLRVSPDGTRVALSILDQDLDIWVWDLAGQTLDRLTFDPGVDIAPSWTPDGQRVVFSSERNGDQFNIFWKAADGTGTAERLTESERAQVATVVVPDGTRVLGTARDDVVGPGDLITVTLDGEPAVETLLMTEFDEREPRFPQTADGWPTNRTSQDSSKSMSGLFLTWRGAVGRCQRVAGKIQCGPRAAVSCSTRLALA